MNIATISMAIANNEPNASSTSTSCEKIAAGALSSAIIIYGISLAYGITGSTNIGEVILDRHL